MKKEGLKELKKYREDLLKIFAPHVKFAEDLKKRAGIKESFDDLKKLNDRYNDEIEGDNLYPDEDEKGIDKVLNVDDDDQEDHDDDEDKDDIGTLKETEFSELDSKHKQMMQKANNQRNKLKAQYRNLLVSIQDEVKDTERMLKFVQKQRDTSKSNKQRSSYDKMLNSLEENLQKFKDQIG